jgi:hypothetical protein
LHPAADQPGPLQNTVRYEGKETPAGGREELAMQVELQTTDYLSGP